MICLWPHGLEAAMSGEKQMGLIEAFLDPKLGLNRKLERLSGRSIGRRWRVWPNRCGQRRRAGRPIRRRRC